MENIKIMSVREGEEHESPYRSGRFYSVKNEWFYSVRETEDQGPFMSKHSAENNLKSYLNDYEHFSANKKNFITDTLKMI